MRTALCCSQLAAVYSNSRHADTQTRRCTETQAPTRTDALAQTHRHTDARTHTNTHTHTHTHPHTHTHTTHPHTERQRQRHSSPGRYPSLVYLQLKLYCCTHLHLKSREQALWKEFAMTVHSFGKQATRLLKPRSHLIFWNSRPSGLPIKRDGLRD